MMDITLPRTGLPALSFHGERLAGADSRYATSGARDVARWHEITVYRAVSSSDPEIKKLVLAVSYRSRWEGELDHDRAAVYRDLASIPAALAEINPCEWLVGYPPIAAYAEKQARVRADLSARWAIAVSEILDALGIVEGIDTAPASPAGPGLEDEEEEEEGEEGTTWNR